MNLSRCKLHIIFFWITKQRITVKLNLKPEKNLKNLQAPQVKIWRSKQFFFFCEFFFLNVDQRNILQCSICEVLILIFQKQQPQNQSQQKQNKYSLNQRFKYFDMKHEKNYIEMHETRLEEKFYVSVIAKCSQSTCNTWRLQSFSRKKFIKPDWHLARSCNFASEDSKENW